MSRSRATLLAAIALLAGFAWWRASSGASSPERQAFTARTLTGADWSLGEHRGRRPVLLNFFATW